MNLNMVLPPFDPDDLLYVLNSTTPTFDTDAMPPIPQLQSPSSSDKSSNSCNNGGGGLNSTGSSSNNNYNQLQLNTNNMISPSMNSSSSSSLEKKKNDGLVRKLCCLCENEKGHPNGFLVATDQINRLPSNLSFMVSDKHLDYLKKQRQAKNICCDPCWATKIQPIIGEFPASDSTTTLLTNINNINNNNNNINNSTLMILNNNNHTLNTIDINHHHTMNYSNNNIIINNEENGDRRKITSPKSKQKTSKKKKTALPPTVSLTNAIVPVLPVPLPTPEPTSYDQVFNRSIPERKKFLQQHVHPLLFSNVCKGNKEAYQTLLEDLSQSPHFLIQNYRLESLLKPVRNVNRKITKSHITRYILKKRLKFEQK